MAHLAQALHATRGRTNAGRLTGLRCLARLSRPLVPQPPTFALRQFATRGW